MRVGTIAQKNTERFHSNTMLTSRTCENHDFSIKRIAQSYIPSSIVFQKITELV